MDDAPFAFAALIPELAVGDRRASVRFYCGLLGFAVAYDQPEEGFAFLLLGDAQLMVQEIGADRVLAPAGAPLERPLGRDVNLQIAVPATGPPIERLTAAGVALALPPEDRWYRAGGGEAAVRQFAVLDPDGYYLRLAQGIGWRPERAG